VRSRGSLDPGSRGQILTLRGFRPGAAIRRAAVPMPSRVSQGPPLPPDAHARSPLRRTRRRPQIRIGELLCLEIGQKTGASTRVAAVADRVCQVLLVALDSELGDTATGVSGPISDRQLIRWPPARADRRRDYRGSARLPDLGSYCQLPVWQHLRLGAISQPGVLAKLYE
jgi:hypothetical protein